MSRRHPATLPSALAPLAVRDCSTCRASCVVREDGVDWLACELAGDPEGAAQVWRDTQAELDAWGWPTSHLSPCPLWSPAWGEES